MSLSGSIQVAVVEHDTEVLLCSPDSLLGSGGTGFLGWRGGRFRAALLPLAQRTKPPFGSPIRTGALSPGELAGS